MLCPKRVVEKSKNDGFQQHLDRLLVVLMWGLSCSLNLRNKFTMSSLIRMVLVQVVRKRNSEKETSSANPFDALNLIKKDDELGSNGGSPNTCKKVVQDVVDKHNHGLVSTATMISPSTISLR
ncbi:hypothetical protein CTI12_AA337840 [Artemisia annua]|uniref:Uncharacterized protein n=1 Tax=Artemisia annua TaxID=35608 RepID=A0A2U1MVN9_ARTAN|nr:hypothetical protein CTI12_AA337840 [Artemisia annua]